MGVYEPGVISRLEDVKGDGRPDAIVTESGTCHGNIGQLLAAQPTEERTVAAVDRQPA